LESKQQDRISKYLTPHISEMMFGELSPDYLKRTDSLDILGGIAVPVNSDPDDESGAIDVRRIVFDMARVIGADPSFVYADRYAGFIRHAAGDNAAPMLVAEGARSADAGDYEDACMLLRAALRLEPKSREALYLYARACKECYEAEAEAFSEGEADEERIGMFKAESMETFELLTMLHPEFAMGYYFLGYAYLNMGLYLKTSLTWQDFMKYSSGTELETSEMDDDMMASLRDEISGRLEELEAPVQIEQGCNRIMSGDYQGGKEILDEYRDGRFAEWWPLWYYLGTAESALGNADEAAACYKRVLRLSPSNTDAMEELAAIYALAGDEENASKYRKKIEIVKRGSDDGTPGGLA
jgi:tetratricopeptide (TPR) repeat protein